jgi:hypothetical protein
MSGYLKPAILNLSQPVRMISSALRPLVSTTKTVNTLLSDARGNENKMCMGRWLHAMKCMVVDDQDVSVTKTPVDDQVVCLDETCAYEADDGGLSAITITNVLKTMQTYRASSKGVSPFPIQVSASKDVHDTDSKMRGEFCFAVSSYQNEFRNSVASLVLKVANLFNQAARQWLKNCYRQKTFVMKYVEETEPNPYTRFDEFTIHVGFFPHYVAVVTVCITKILFNKDYDCTRKSQHLADIQVETFKYEASQRSRLECLLQTPQTCLPYQDDLRASHREMRLCTLHREDMESLLEMFDPDRRIVMGRLWDGGRFNPSGMKANRLRSCIADPSGMVICTRCGKFVP